MGHHGDSTNLVTFKLKNYPKKFQSLHYSLQIRNTRDATTTSAAVLEEVFRIFVCLCVGAHSDIFVGWIHCALTAQVRASDI